MPGCQSTFRPNNDGEYFKYRVIFSVCVTACDDGLIEHAARIIMSLGSSRDRCVRGGEGRLGAVLLTQIVRILLLEICISVCVIKNGNMYIKYI